VHIELRPAYPGTAVEMNPPPHAALVNSQPRGAQAPARGRCAHRTAPRCTPRSQGSRS